MSASTHSPVEKAKRYTSVEPVTMEKTRHPAENRLPYMTELAAAVVV